jgi:hypothetical protein
MAAVMIGIDPHKVRTRLRSAVPAEFVTRSVVKPQVAWSRSGASGEMA